MQEPLSYTNTKFASISLSLVTIACLVFTLALEFAQASEDEPPVHVGKISAAQLLSDYPAFAEEYNTYEPSPEDLTQIQSLAGKEVVALFGTWCHDSKREVPRLLKLLELSQVDLKEFTLYGVSRDKGDPDGYAEMYDLKFTPTIVVMDQAKEVARMIESPKESIAGDLASQIMH